MGSDIRRSEVCSPFRLELPACKPPLEVVKDGYAWVVEEFQRGSRNGTTFSTHDSQVDAMRAGKEKMETDRYPCLLRWDSPNSVRGLYWNPVFETLTVRYDALFDAWVVVPAEDHVLFHVADEQSAAYDHAMAVQREYNFRELIVYDGDDVQQATRDHRYIRNSITDSGVKFRGTRTPTTTDEADEDDDEPTETQPTVPSALGTSITDLTDVEILSTEGLLHQYEAPWSDGSTARVLTIAAEHASNQTVADAFWTVVDAWAEISDYDYVATVLDSGENPTPWVAYRAGDYALADVADRLSVDEKLDVLGDVSSALMAAARAEVPRDGVTPANIRLLSADDGLTATLADWGLDWTLQRAVGQPPVTPYAAPEQVSGTRTDRTAVYQLGAVAYRLFCGVTPFSSAGNLKQAIQTGDLSAPNAVGGLSSDASDIIEAAMAPRPEDRYATVQDFYYALREELGNA